MKTSLFIILLLFSITPLHYIEAFSNSEVVDSLNKDREKQNLSILKENSILTLVAQTKANDMAQKGYFSHNSPDGVKPWHFFKLLGYKYTHAGENLAEGFKTATETEKAWIESSEHRTNILNPYFKDVGIGIAEGVNGPKKAYSFPSEPVEYGMITPRQHRALTDLILTNMFQDDRDRMLQQLPEMTSEEASEMIFEIQSAHWR